MLCLTPTPTAAPISNFKFSVGILNTSASVRSIVSLTMIGLGFHGNSLTISKRNQRSTKTTEIRKFSPDCLSWIRGPFLPKAWFQLSSKKHKRNHPAYNGTVQEQGKSWIINMINNNIVWLTNNFNGMIIIEEQFITAAVTAAITITDTSCCVLILSCSDPSR